MAGAPVQGLIAIERCRQSPGKPGLFLWALNQGEAGAGAGAPALGRSSPEGAFQARPRAAFF